MSQQLSFIVAFASVFGAAEAIRQTQAKTRRQEHRSRKNNLLVHCAKSSRHSVEIEGKHVILSGDKVRYYPFFLLFLLFIHSVNWYMPYTHTHIYTTHTTHTHKRERPKGLTEI